MQKQEQLEHQHQDMLKILERQNHWNHASLFVLV